MNDIEILENIITEYSTQKEDYKNLTVPIRFDEKQIEAIEHAITALKERQADKDRINRYENDIDILLNRIDEYEINTVWKYTVKEDYIPKFLVKEKIEELDNQEKKELKGMKGQDRYVVKQEYQHKRNVLQELLGEKQDLQINKEE